MAILNEWGLPYRIAHAAEPNTRRGPQFVVRNDDIDRLIPAGDRKTLASLSNRLFINMGVLKACVLQKADYSVGEAWLPSYIGEGSEEGRAVAKFMSDVWLPQCDVRGGVFDWWKLLELTSIAIDRDGDIFWLMVKGADGFPRIQLIPSHRCYNKEYKATVEIGPYRGYRIVDGVIYYASGRPAAYRFNVGKDGEEKFVDVPASDVIHVYDATHCDQGRGLPSLTHALESMKMCLLSTEDERIRQQIISRLHLTIFNETGGPDLGDPGAYMSGATGTATADFTTEYFPGGVKYMPNDGKSRIEQMKHDNPGPVWEAFHDRMYRDAIIPIWSYNVWKGSGQGTDARAEIMKCRRFVTKRQGVLWYAARRAFSWAYSVFAEAGRVRPLKSPTAWHFSYPPRITVDDGRESKMELDELVTGSRNLSEILEARGLTEDEFLEKRAWSAAKRKIVADRVAKEASKISGIPIKIEEREMMMLTPNEQSAQQMQLPLEDEPSTTQDDEDDPD